MHTVVTDYFTLLSTRPYAVAASIGRMPLDVLSHSSLTSSGSGYVSMRSRINKVKYVTRRLPVRPSYKYHVGAHIWPLLLAVSLASSAG